MSTSTVAFPKRRNGKEQACEPCRRSKLRCDHNAPCCGRCKRRKRTDECRYEASPSKISTPRPGATKAVFDPKGNLPLDLVYPDSYDFFAAGSSYVEKCPNGFLGPTAYSAIFLENQSELDMDSLDPCKGYHKHSNNAGVSSLTHHISLPHNVGRHTLSRAAMRMGMFILNSFPSQQISTMLLDRYTVFDDITSHIPTIKQAHRSLWDTWGTYLQEPREASKLAIASEKLCRNGWSLLGTEPPKNRHEWVNSFTGPHLRWEMIGVLLAIFGLSAISLPDWDPLFATTRNDNRNDRKKFASSMRDLVESCLVLCDHADNVSDLTVDLLQFSTTLQTYCETGKTSE